MELKTDCFAWHNGGCTALSEILCNRRKCPFYKTKAQVESEKEKCEARLQKVFGVKSADNMPVSVAASLAAAGERPKQSYTYKQDRDRGTYHAERIAKLKSEGKCPVCGNENDRPGMFRCSACAARDKALRKAREAIFGEWSEKSGEK